jgi:hypothetical protein
MKIYNGGKVLLGLAVFIIIVTFPFFMNMGKASAKPEVKIDTPKILEWERQYGKKECVEPKEFMRAEHMQLLNTWRDAAVRNSDRVYKNDQGREFVISLQNTCMNCHSNKKEFCDRCHNYVAVNPYCWSCHIAPKESQS